MGFTVRKIGAMIALPIHEKNPSIHGLISFRELVAPSEANDCMMTGTSEVPKKRNYREIL